MNGQALVALHDEQAWREALDTVWNRELRPRLMETILSLPPARPLRMSYEEFLEWADEDTLAEWVDGEVIIHSPAGNRHQDLTDFLVSVLRPFVELHQLGVVRSAPFQMKLTRSGREPDLLFVAKEHLYRLRETHLEGPADLVVEVISPESVRRDRVEKFYEYQAAGVGEYWLIDPWREEGEFYRLREDGRYEGVFVGREGVFRSEVLPGFWLRVEWLWERPLPDTEEVLWTIIGYGTAIERLLRMTGDETLIRHLARIIGRDTLRRLVNEIEGDSE